MSKIVALRAIKSLPARGATNHHVTCIPTPNAKCILNQGIFVQDRPKTQERDHPIHSKHFKAICLLPFLLNQSQNTLDLADVPVYILLKDSGFIVGAMP